MTAKSVDVAELKTKCLQLINDMSRDRQPVTITKHGQPIAVLAPIEPVTRRSIIGAMKGTVLRFDDPTTPVWD